jgi:gamma-glutamyltranspeptidase / glutathione hydrolase
MRPSPRPLVVIAAALGLAATAAPAAAVPHAHAVARGSGGAVASLDLDASRAGLAVLRQGGNAVDAAVATAAALGVSEPYVAGPGGGGFMVVYLARSHRVVTIDGRESCPARCTRTMFVGPGGDPLDFDEAVASGLSVGVPGNVATWDVALRRYGTRSLAAALRPAERLARRGFRVDATFREETLHELSKLRAFRSTRRLLLTRSGGALPTGTLLRNPALARTYALVGREGARAFYNGAIARAVARTVRRPPVSAGTPLHVRRGFLTASDMRRYRALLRPPTHVRYRGLDVYGMGPPSSGGSTIGEALRILAGYRLGAEPRALALHHYLEASRLAFADRAAYVADPRYVHVPLRALLSPAYAATRRCLIGERALQSPVAPGDPYPPFGGCGSGSAAGAASEPAGSTNHIVTADRYGNVVSYTQTIEQLGGSGMVVPGYGFLLNNEMTDFDFVPSVPGHRDPNLAAPGKQPRSSMAPTIVLRHRRPWIGVGSPGGSTIITTVLQVLLDRIDFGMPLPRAIAAPRVSQRNATPSEAERAFLRLPVAAVLRRRHGQPLAPLEGPFPIDRELGAVTVVELLGGGRMLAAAEPVRRGGGSALVVSRR